MMLYIKSEEMSTLSMNTFAEKSIIHHAFSLHNGRRLKIVSLLWHRCLSEYLHMQTKKPKNIRLAVFCDLSTTKHVQTHTQHTCTPRLSAVCNTATKYFVISRTAKGSENKVTFSPVLLLKQAKKTMQNSCSKLRKTSFSQIQ